MPRSSSTGISFCNCASDRVSETVTRAPWSCRKNAAATPDRPSPTTSTLLSFNSMLNPLSHELSSRHAQNQRAMRQGETQMLLAQLQGSKRKQCNHQGGDPEANDDFRLRPAHQFEVMMDWGHLENPFLAQLIRTHLQNHRKSLNHKDSADKGQQQFLLDDH